jgi:hypothetical protein
MYHWLPTRIATHVRICVLSLLVERVAELACDKTWSHIQEALDTLQVSEFHTPSHRFFQLNEPTELLKETLKALKIPLPQRILGVRPHSQSIESL